MTNLAEDDQKFLQELAEALGVVINSELFNMPVIHLQALVLVAENEGQSIGAYAKRTGYSISVMLRHLLDLRERFGGLVDFKSKTEGGGAILTPKARALISKLCDRRRK